MEETHFAFWLSNIIKMPNSLTTKLLQYAGSYEEIWELNKKELTSLSLKIPEEKVNLLLTQRDEQKIITAYTEMQNKGIMFLYQGHPLYPTKLLNIHNAPNFLYCLGRLPTPSILSVAIIGARTCSEYGRYISRKLGSTLGQSGIQIISGLALGIDGIAQKGALDAGGYSCGVLGCGVDVCYPPGNKEIYDSLVQNGGIISEYPAGTAPCSGFFPARNRIISGLSDVVVVIEARERSGSLITADLALEQGKDIYAFPGRVTDSLSHGCNRLIRQGAGIILSPEEFIQDLLVDYTHNSIPAQDSEICQMDISDFLPLCEEEKKILSTLSLDPKSINKIQDETRIPFGKLTNHLMKLSLRGLILQNGSFYTRTT